jgi:adenine deaminase
MARIPAPERVLAVSRGQEPADLLVTNGAVFVPFTREWVRTDLAIADGVVAAWGAREALDVVDVAGAAVTPGFIDAHLHVESTMLWIDEFVRAVVPHGTLAAAADPHELANVAGGRGVTALVDAAAGLPFTLALMVPSCVPASRFERGGARLGAAETADLLSGVAAAGLAEVMDIPAVVGAERAMRHKIGAVRPGQRVDGHAPGLTAGMLDTYLAAGVESDHECTVLAEVEEKRRKGMWVFLREGSAAHDLVTLVPTVLAHGTERVALCTDDRDAASLQRGHVNDCVRLAVAHGVTIEDALVLVTANPAEYLGLHHLGSLGPGCQADLLCFGTLAAVSPDLVLQHGRIVARDGLLVDGAVPHRAAPGWLRETVVLARLPSAADLDLARRLHGDRRVPAIGVSAGSIVTGAVDADLDDPTVDLSRAAVVERYGRSGTIGLGYVSGLGLRRGALATTVAHDAHNLVVVGGRGGQGPADMAAAVARVAELGGGVVVVDDGTVVAEVPLPIAGLMSDRPAAVVADRLDRVDRAARALGIDVPAPVTLVSFLALTVIPHRRLTERGVLDVDAGHVMPVSS